MFADDSNKDLEELENEEAKLKEEYSSLTERYKKLKEESFFYSSHPIFQIVNSSDDNLKDQIINFFTNENNQNHREYLQKEYPELFSKLHLCFESLQGSTPAQ